MPNTSDVAWIIGLRLQSVVKREFDWVVDFDDGTRLTIECLWRLTEAGTIRVTSRDNGRQFGRQSPVISADEVNGRLAGALVTSVELRDGTLDLDICFDGAYRLQVIPESSLFEAWNLGGQNQLIVAVGGGDLTILRDTRR